MADEEDNFTTADAQAALTADLGTAAARLQELLGGQADRPISSLPKWQREEVQQIRAMIAEWLEALREARHG